MFDGNAMSFVIQEIARFNNNSNDEFLEYFYKSTKTEIGMRQEKHDFSYFLCIIYERKPNIGEFIYDKE